MPEEQLKVGITGDASGLEQASKQAVSSLNSIGKASTILQGQVTRLQKLLSLPNLSFSQVERLNGLLSKTQGQLAKMGNAAKSVVPGANQATQALGNLSRVAQDAPFGFIGIANNINPLLESFQRLKAETGSAKGALSALGSSLMGAGGLGLAVGVVSSLLVVFGDKLFKSGKEAESQADQIKKARQALDDYVDGLNDVDKARVKGLQNAQEELVNLKTLYDATQNANIPIAERKKLVDELQNQYPKYFANIKDEIILAGGAKDAYDKLSTSILAAAKARAAQDTLVDIEKQALAVNQKISANAAEQIKLQQQLNAVKKQPTTTTSATGEERLTSAGAKANKLQDQLNSSVNEGNGLLKQRNDLLSRANVLSDNISRIVEKTPESLLKPTANLPKVDKEKSKKDDDELKKLLEEKKAILLEFIKDFETIKVPVPNLSMDLEKFDAKGLTKELNDKLNKALVNVTPLNLTVPTNLQAVDPKNVPIPLKPTITWSPTEFQKKYESFLEQVEALIKNTEESLAINLGEGIAAAISGDGLEDAFRNIAGIMGDFIQSLGKLLIKESIQVQIFKKALASLIANPVAGLAVGVGLVALGAIIKKTAMPKMKGFAKGGWVDGQGNGDTVPAMLTPKEYVLTKSKAKFWVPIIEAFEGKSGIPKLNSGKFHFADGGFVPSVERSNPIQQIKNIIQPASNNFPEYLPAFSMTHDQFRLWYRRAESYGNKFGR